MKCTAVLVVLSALCCCALSAAVPAAGHLRSKVIVRQRLATAKYAQRRSSESGISGTALPTFNTNDQLYHFALVIH